MAAFFYINSYLMKFSIGGLIYMKEFEKFTGEERGKLTNRRRTVIENFRNDEGFRNGGGARKKI